MLARNSKIFLSPSTTAAIQYAFKSTSTPNAAATATATAVADAQAKQAGLKSYNDIPGPKSRYLFGTLLSLNSFGGEFDMIKYREFQLELQAKYGDIVRWEVLNQKMVYLFHPEYIKLGFRADGTTPNRPAAEFFLKLQELVGIRPSILNSQGERWRAMRSASNPIVARPQSIMSYISFQNQVGNEFIEYIEKKFAENGHPNKLTYNGFDQMLRLLALEYLSEIVFDKRLKCIDEKTRLASVTEFVNNVEAFFVSFGLLAFAPPFWKIYPTKDWKMFEKHGRLVYQQVTDYLKEAQENWEKNKNEEGAKNTILGQFLSRREKYNLELADIVSIMTDLLIAGVDTTSISTYHLLYELGKNQQVQQNLYEEINSVLKGSTDVTEDHIAKLKYLKNVVKESGRLHSVVPSNARLLSQDLVIEDYLIPKGTLLAMGNSYITQSERFFKNPKQFDPSRWEREEEVDPFSVLSFGHGTRMCIGRRIAEQEIYLTLIKLVQKYRIEYHEQAPGYKIGLLATPDKPLNIVFEKRQ